MEIKIDYFKQLYKIMTHWFALWCNNPNNTLGRRATGCIAHSIFYFFFHSHFQNFAICVRGSRHDYWEEGNVTTYLVKNVLTPS